MGLKWWIKKDHNPGISRLMKILILIDEQLLGKNFKKRLSMVKERTGCKISLAQNVFLMFSVYPLIAEYLDDNC